MDGRQQSRHRGSHEWLYSQLPFWQRGSEGVAVLLGLQHKPAGGKRRRKGHAGTATRGLGGGEAGGYILAEFVLQLGLERPWGLGRPRLPSQTGTASSPLLTYLLFLSSRLRIHLCLQFHSAGLLTVTKLLTHAVPMRGSILNQPQLTPCNMFVFISCTCIDGDAPI